MANFRVVPLETGVARHLRGRETDDFANPIRRGRAEDDTTPCRHCLDHVAPGGEVILAGHSPFPLPGPYREVGPIYLHAAECPAYAAAATVPPIVRKRLIALRAYDADQSIIDADLVEGAEAEGLIARLFANPAARFLHARTARNGCFLCRIERA